MWPRVLRRYNNYILTGHPEVRPGRCTSEIPPSGPAPHRPADNNLPMPPWLDKGRLSVASGQSQEFPEDLLLKFPFLGILSCTIKPEIQPDLSNGNRLFNIIFNRPDRCFYLGGFHIPRGGCLWPDTRQAIPAGDLQRTILGTVVHIDGYDGLDAGLPCPKNSPFQVFDLI